MKIKKKNPKYLKLWGYRALRTQDLSDTYYYECVKDASVGRTLSTLVKRLVPLERQNPKTRAYYVLNPQNLTISGNVKYLVGRYKSRFDAGHKTKGPFYKKDPLYFTKKMLRNMMKYKTKHAHLYKKICFLDRHPGSQQLEARKSVKLSTINIRASTLTSKVRIPDLLNKIYTSKSQ